MVNPFVAILFPVKYYLGWRSQNHAEIIEQGHIRDRHPSIHMPVIHRVDDGFRSNGSTNIFTQPI
jgi:hypothetical protein